MANSLTSCSSSFGLPLSLSPSNERNPQKKKGGKGEEKETDEKQQVRLIRRQKKSKEKEKPRFHSSGLASMPRSELRKSSPDFYYVRTRFSVACTHSKLSVLWWHIAPKNLGEVFPPLPFSRHGASIVFAAFSSSSHLFRGLVCTRPPPSPPTPLKVEQPQIPSRFRGKELRGNFEFVSCSSSARWRSSRLLGGRGARAEREKSRRRKRKGEEGKRDAHGTFSAG